MTLSDHQRLAVKEAYAAYFKTPTNASKAHAKSLMQDPTAPATCVLIAAHHLLGDTFLAYEPETLWLELDPCPINRDKLSAAVALARIPSFYWDYRVFGATVHALNNEQVIPETVPHCTPAQMAWGVFEAELIFALTDTESTKPEYQPAIEAYVAVSLFDEGMSIPAVGLNFCSDELKKLLPADAAGLCEETRTTWDALPKDHLDLSKIKDGPLGAQILKLADSWLYVVSRTKSLRAALAQF